MCFTRTHASWGGLRAAGAVLFPQKTGNPKLPRVPSAPLSLVVRRIHFGLTRREVFALRPSSHYALRQGGLRHTGLGGTEPARSRAAAILSLVLSGRRPA